MASPLVVPKARFFDVDGLPLVGGKLYSYMAGTVTPKATYTDASGTVPNANPVILDGNGEASIWLAGAYKLRLTDAADVDQWIVDNVKEFLVSPAGSFTLVSSAPTVIDATTFSIPGDQTPYFFADQRVKFVTSTTTVYSRVVSAIFGAGITTVVLANGIINVGAPIGAYAGLGDPGLPIDARHVAYGTTGSVEDKILAMEADFTPAGGGVVTGPTTFDDNVTFDGDVTFNGAVTFNGLTKVNVLAEGALSLVGDTVIAVPASVAGYSRVLLRIDGLVPDAASRAWVRFNADAGADYDVAMIRWTSRNSTGALVGFDGNGLTAIPLLDSGYAVIGAAQEASFDIEVLNPNGATIKLATIRGGALQEGITYDRVEASAVWHPGAPAALNSITLVLADGTLRGAGPLTLLNPSGAARVAVAGTYRLIGEY